MKFLYRPGREGEVLQLDPAAMGILLDEHGATPVPPCWAYVMTVGDCRRFFTRDEIDLVLEDDEMPTLDSPWPVKRPRDRAGMSQP